MDMNKARAKIYALYLDSVPCMKWSASWSHLNVFLILHMHWKWEQAYLHLSDAMDVPKQESQEI